MASNPQELRRRLDAAIGDHYVLERELGRGGMGVVFLARDVTLERPVAIKVVQPELAEHSTIAQRFLAEARTIAKIRHPNIVAVHSAGQVDGLLYYVMDFVEGESLRQLLNRQGRLAPELATRIADDVAAALDAAGAAGVIHRDIKPANVLLEASSGKAMLVDFGIARIAGGDGTMEITGDGMVLGTPTYMSPEQASGEPIDARSDIYSLGVLSYEMVAGAPPFDGPGRLVVSKHISSRPTALGRVRRDCPASLANTVMRALEKNPDERWQSGAEFRAGLHRTPAPRRKPALWAAAAVAALILAGTWMAPWRSGSSAPPEGINPRHSFLVLPFDNLRDDPGISWLSDGSVSMLTLNLSQWHDLQVVDQGRVYDLLLKSGLSSGEPIGLSRARELAREAGVWTVVLGEFDQEGDSLHLLARVYDVASGNQVDLERLSGTGDDVRPLFDRLASDLLDLSGAPSGIEANLAAATTNSVEAYRAYLEGVQRLNSWELGQAVTALENAAAIDSTFGLAYYYLAVARGWIVGANDSVANEAISLAQRHSDNLPLKERTLIRAYRAFLEGQMEASRAYYQAILKRSPDDADAWYGLGEAWFHDDKNLPVDQRWTNALAAFTRTRQIDPNYALAFDHVKEILHNAARNHPEIALVAGDRLVLTHDHRGRPVMEQDQLDAAVDRARGALLELARSWVANQPGGLRAQNALIDAYVDNERYTEALSEADQVTADGRPHPESPFVRARIFFAEGRYTEAGESLREALDTVAPLDFSGLDPSFNVVRTVETSANVMAYQGDLENARRAIQLADQVRSALDLLPVTHSTEVDPFQWQRWRLGHLYASTGAPVATQRRVWESAAEAARQAKPEHRADVARTGAAAALGIFMQTADTTPLTELRAISGDEFSREVRAWLAMNRNDVEEARDILSQPETDSVKSVWDYYWNTQYRKPLAAELYYALGDYQQTLALLEDYQPDRFLTDWFDVRWGMLGRVRLLRARAFEGLGRLDEAELELEQVVAQWSHSDESIEPMRREAEAQLARLRGLEGAS